MASQQGSAEGGSVQHDAACDVLLLLITDLAIILSATKNINNKIRKKTFLIFDLIIYK